MSDRSLAELEEFFLALSDGTRLRLLELMRDGEVSVGYLSDELGQSQPKISRHLAYLRSAGLVETRRDGKWIYYRIAAPSSRLLSASLEAALDWVASLTGASPRKEYAAERPYLQHETAVSGESTEEVTYTNEIEIYLL